MTSNVAMIGEETSAMTFRDGLAFVARTRRQLERFALLPEGDKQRIDPTEKAAIRRLCDEVEADINASLGAS